MGSPESETDRESNENSQHQVTIANPFYLGKYEVTQAQWIAVMGTDPSRDCGIGVNYPVYYVSWDDCKTFIQALNQMGVGTFRLPTEAEWEYACRAGTSTRFYWEDDSNYSLINLHAWYDSNTNFHSHEVGEKQANSWGLYDISGNVWEWCEDDLHGTYNGAPSDGSAWVDLTRSPYRIARGGSWGYSTHYCRSAYRGSSTPDYCGAYFGLRLVKVIP